MLRPRQDGLVLQTMVWPDELYTDSYREAVEAVIEAKQAGTRPEAVPTAEPPAEVVGPGQRAARVGERGARGAGAGAQRLLSTHPGLVTRLIDRLATLETRSLLTRIPLYAGPLPEPCPDRPPWPGQTIRSGGADLHVRHTPGPGAPDPGRGAPDPGGAERIVYLHGLGGSSTNFTDVAGLLASQLPGMALDLPGFGYSAPPPGFDYAPDSHAEVVAGFLAGLRTGPVHLVGNSMGGAVALLVAARYPGLVRTLTLLAPAMPDLRIDPRRLSDPRSALTLLPFVGPRVRRLLAGTPPQERSERILRLCFADPSAVSPARRAAAVQELAVWAAQDWAAAALNGSTERLIRSWLVSGSRSLWRVAAAVRAPALVIWGAADKVVSARKAPRTATALPRGRLFLLPRTGHVPQMERPSSVARAVLGMINSVNHYRW